MAMSDLPSRPSPGRDRQAGISMLDVTATLFVLTAVALGVALLVVPIARQSRIHREATTANAEAQRMLEEIQATPFNEIVTLYPDGTVRPIPSLPNGEVLVSYTDVDSDPLRIHVDVRWSSLEIGDMSRTFHTVRTE